MSETVLTESTRRRNFAIISHPDAGKTTLTEALLLSGGAIHLAGQVRARGERRRTQSDWMKIERDRGISVSSSVMTFSYNDLVFNLLDTPGHEDFSEDTYRTLTATDSAIMVLDAAKGIEPQTLKLFEVCRLRDIPIITLINKMDREALDPFELIDEISDKLALDAAPLYWPAGSGKRFAGMVDLTNDELVLYDNTPNKTIGIRPTTKTIPFESHKMENILDGMLQAELEEHLELVKGAMPEFNPQSYLEGHMSPVIFGSALRNFGIRELLDTLANYAPPPKTQNGIIKGQIKTIPCDKKYVSGFVFKIQANMDPNHRDRIAFVRLCSGRFKRGMRLKTASGKQINVHNPLMFMAQDREIADEAFAGDVIGIPNHGVLRVGDALSENGDIRFEGIPNFAPEILRRAMPDDPLKAKHLRKALQSLAEEGVTQLFTPILGADMIVGAVGVLQIDVMAERMVSEYNLNVRFEVPVYNVARWVAGEASEVKAFAEKNRAAIAHDLDADIVFLAKNVWEVGYMEDKYPNLQFLTSKERRI